MSQNISSNNITHNFAETSIQTTTKNLTDSIEETFKVLDFKKQLENVAIFVDYDNVYWTLMKYYNHNPDHDDPDKNLILRLWERYGQDHVRSFRVYADFEKVKASLTSLQKKRVQIRHVYSNGKDGDNRKNSSDIELCIDAIESTYKDPNISCYVFVTADSDMIPILSRMMYKGKRVELFYLSEAAPKYVELSSYAHYSEDLIDFLNIEKKTYNIEEYIISGLQFINKWYETYGNTDKFLGPKWLKEKLSEELNIPEVIVSKLIERLEVEQFIKLDKKILTNGSTRNIINLTENGRSLLDSQFTMAK